MAGRDVDRCLWHPRLARPGHARRERADAGGPSGFYEVEDIDVFYAEHHESVSWVEPPQDAPPIRFASFTDSAGILFRIFQNVEDV